jgi:CRP-like cAMP-binding protein
MPPNQVDSPQNGILASLPVEVLARLRPRLQQVNLQLGQPLSGPDAPVQHVYFPQRGMVSLVRPMRDGAMVEVGIIGREGFVGMSALLGGDINIIERMVQIAGSALRIPAEPLQVELARIPALRSEMLKFSQALLAQVAQTAACNGRHTLQQRLARWLLMARERIDQNVVTLSHELLSMMLGVRRPGVTVALGKFGSAGLVKYGRGKIEILDQAGLEATACECYGDVRAEYKRLLS